MVRDTLKPSFRDASCCNVDVVNGAAGFLVDGLVSMDETTCSAEGKPRGRFVRQILVLKVLSHVAFT